MIEFAHVTKSYGRDAPAVSDLSLVIPAHRTTVIVGPSGCGKTTTLRMINRMLEPNAGEIRWDGRPLNTLGKTELRRSMGYVIQSGGLFPHRTVAANIATVPRLLHWDSRRIAGRVRELMELTELPESLADRYPAELSGGQQQRVGVARGLAADPDVLLMDEPFSAVDPVVRAGLQDLVRGLQRELDKTIVMITHDLDEAIRMGDQVAIMKDGAIVQAGPPAEILDEPATDFVREFIGRDRGYRGLGFAAAAGLRLTAVDTTRAPGTATTERPVLVLDARGRPVGWVDPRLPGGTMDLGTVFDPATDSLRVALDAALSSPVGRAVAVAGPAARYAGVVTIADLLTAVATHRDDLAESRAERAAHREVAVAEPAEPVSGPGPVDDGVVPEASS
ncbi:ABC transporter ATP-binding protein [Propionicicella superfundia]|uniref:ABC transporter ATP-binding protein n=1 Tax=Propionicicella superfundia TaxID=348582 RepID=UPI000413B74E|nr:ABC transporter ATP-binding protein [Propionicicella superfundia]